MKHTEGTKLTADQFAHLILAHMLVNNLSELKIYPDSIKHPDNKRVDLKLFMGKDDKGVYVEFKVEFPEKDKLQ